MLNRRSTSAGLLREMAPPPRAPAGFLLFLFIYLCIITVLLFFFFFHEGVAGLATTGVEEGTRINKRANE